MTSAVCKKCRRLGQRLFLKEERCFTPKCAMVKRAYPPGTQRKKGRKRKSLSEYGLQLAEKQKLSQIYGVREKQLKRYLEEASREKGVIGENLLKKLETRLDNTVFRLGFAGSRKKARQLVSHKHILVNNRQTNLSSFSVKPTYAIQIKKSSLNSTLFADLKTKLKKYKAPDWLSLNKEKLEGKITSWPEPDDINIPVDIQMIIEYYSR